MCLDGDDAAAFGIAGAAPEAVALGISPFAGPQYHGCTAFGTNRCRTCMGGHAVLLVTVACDALQCDAHLLAHSDNALGFIVGIAIQVAVFRTLDQYPHLVVIHLAELIEVQAGDDAHLFIEVALGMEVLAKAGADIGELLEPADLFRLKLTFAIDDPHIDLEAVLVGQQLLDPVIELEEGTDQDQSFLGVLDQLFKEIVGCAGIQKFGHNKLPVLGNVMCSLVTVGSKTDLHPWHSTASQYPSPPHAHMLGDTGGT